MNSQRIIIVLLCFIVCGHTFAQDMDTELAKGTGETNHITIVFRVAGWPDAFSEHLSDVGNSPSTGNVLDITKDDSTVFSNP